MTKSSKSKTVLSSLMGADAEHVFPLAASRKGQPLIAKAAEGFAIAAPVLPNLAEMQSLTGKGGSGGLIMPLVAGTNPSATNGDDYLYANKYSVTNGKDGNDTINFTFVAAPNSWWRTIDGGADNDTLRACLRRTDWVMASVG